ncbi:hypothetical protein [Zavarzinella formosa]|uniref:hypothetical protein n=1 Tax=Zavarzinella formosa TaxID=360055 RepID=UPI0012FA02AE|nr:hypothetical protein [Zavarzinella formosa]
MQIDLETVRWLLSGFFLISGSLITWLLGRKVELVDSTLKEHDGRIDVNLQQINGIKQDFVSKADLKEQLNIQLSPIKDDMRDIKGDVKALLQRP